MPLDISDLRGKRKQPEKGLHKAVAKYLNLALPRDAFWFHVPNGGMRNLAEAQDLKSMGTRAGVPDILITYCGITRGIELKDVGSYLSKAQREAHEGLARAGMPLVVCRSTDEVQAALDSWSIPIRARTLGFGSPPKKPRRKAA